MNNDSEKEKTCKNCLFSHDYGESTLYIKCEKGRKKHVEKSGTCKDWTPRRIGRLDRREWIESNNDRQWW